MTDTQNENLHEWFKRMRENFSWEDAIVIFNGLDPVNQKKIYGRPWFSLTTGNPIKRDLIPTNTPVEELIEKGLSLMRPDQREQYERTNNK